MITKRREFLKSAGTLASGMILTGTKANGITLSSISNLIKIEEPFHGAILNNRYGIKTDNGLKIMVKGEAPQQSNVTVNGIPAKREGSVFISEIVLKDRETEITAKADGWFGQNSHSVKVIWDKNSFPRYRFSIDDNIFFLRDIARNKYNSLYDCFYLKGLKELNRKYGTKFVLNIYYTDGLEFTDKKEFDLTQFPDRYKSEWQDNSDWLKLAFHGYSNSPDRLYQYAPPKKVIDDLDKVNEQIFRFAGEQTYSPPTVIHWGMVQPPALKLLAKKGVKVLSGGFDPVSSGWDINYFVDDIRSEYISRNNNLMDFENEIIFSLINLVCNSTPIERIEPELEITYQDTRRSEIMDIFTHEQYFWPFYSNYIPDHFQRLDRALNWLTNHGYKPVFFHEGFLGAPC